MIVKDGNFDRIDPAQLFTERFPPTFFLHGADDDWVLPRFSEAAYQRLTALGVESRFALIEGQVHGFDATLTHSDSRYEHVKEAFEFLKKHVYN